MISVIIPVMRRNGADVCIEFCIKNAGIDRELFEIVEEENPNKIPVSQMVKKLVEKTKYDLVFFLHDDSIPQPDFMKNALKAMNDFEDGWGLVVPNDLFTFGKATHWLAHKKLLPLLDGEFFYSGYRHSYVDDELTERCKELNKYKYCEDSKIVHNNPIINKGVSYDDDYKRCYNDSNVIYDKNLFKRRIKSGWTVGRLD